MADGQFKTLIDGECPLWKREGTMLNQENHSYVISVSHTWTSQGDERPSLVPY